MIKIVDECAPTWNDNWKSVEYKVFYKVYKDDVLIARTPFNPRSLFKELDIEFVEESYD